MGAYYLNYISDRDSISLVVEQGQEINKNGSVVVHAVKSDNTLEVEIEGTAVFVKDINLNT